jgi:hypothetical protein
MEQYGTEGSTLTREAVTKVTCIWWQIWRPLLPYMYQNRRCFLSPEKTCLVLTFRNSDFELLGFHYGIMQWIWPPGGQPQMYWCLMLYWSEKMIWNSMYLPPNTRLIHLITVFCFRVDPPSLLWRMKPKNSQDREVQIWIPVPQSLTNQIRLISPINQSNACFARERLRWRFHDVRNVVVFRFDTNTSDTRHVFSGEKFC